VWKSFSARLSLSVLGTVASDDAGVDAVCAGIHGDKLVPGGLQLRGKCCPGVLVGYGDEVGQELDVGVSCGGGGGLGERYCKISSSNRMAVNYGRMSGRLTISFELEGSISDLAIICLSATYL
jgi:hypothetical protein